MASLTEKALEFRENAKTYEKPRITWWKPKYRKAAEDYCRAAQFHYQVPMVQHKNLYLPIIQNYLYHQRFNGVVISI